MIISLKKMKVSMNFKKGEKMKFLKCIECKYEKNCPVKRSYLNAACLTIQKPKTLEQLKEDYEEQLEWDYMAHMDIRG